MLAIELQFTTDRPAAGCRDAPRAGTWRSCGGVCLAGTGSPSDLCRDARCGAARAGLIEGIRKELEAPIREYTVDGELRFPMHSYLAQAHS
jgi:hypothetical protein